MEFLILWVICGSFCAFIAGTKNRSKGNWFILGLIFGFFALIAIACIPAIKETQAPGYGDLLKGNKPAASSPINDVKSFAKQLKAFNPNKTPAEIIAVNEVIINHHTRDLSEAARRDFIQVLEHFLAAE